MPNIKWFTAESKKFMGYGKETSKTKFWFEYPKAFIVFYCLCFKDFIKCKVLRLI